MLKKTFNILVTSNKASIVGSLNKLLTQFLKIINQPLFINYIKTLSYNYAIKKLQEKVCVITFKKNYTSYLFRKKTVTSIK